MFLNSTETVVESSIRDGERLWTCNQKCLFIEKLNKKFRFTPTKHAKNLEEREVIGNIKYNGDRILYFSILILFYWLSWLEYCLFMDCSLWFQTCCITPNSRVQNLFGSPTHRSKLPWIHVTLATSEQKRIWIQNIGPQKAIHGPFLEPRPLTLSVGILMRLKNTILYRTK